MPWSELQLVYPDVIHESNFFDDMSIKDAQNFCRNPSMDADGPWCYVHNDDGIAVESCDLCQSLGEENFRGVSPLSCESIS